MPYKQDYSDHNKVLVMIRKAQNAEQDQREKAREAKRFLTDRNGQWDQESYQKMDGRFRGTFDMCTPIIDGIAGEIEQSDFTLRTSPASGEASKDTAKTLDGLIRNIRNISNAEDTFNSAGRSNAICGFDCWEVEQDWIDADSFDQDLFIRRVPSALDSVWFDLSSTLQDRSDANWSVKLSAIPVDEYHARWEKRSGMSLGDDSRSSDPSCRWNSKEIVTIAKLYYRKPRNIEIVEMSNGKVYKDDEEFQSVKDELALEGVTETRRRTRKGWRVYSRLLDGEGWLAKEEETVFDYQPLVPVYGNFDIVNNEVVYYGKIENLLDPQRTLNYALSRDIEDGALSPSPSYWMTRKQAAGNDYSRMNTDRAPIRLYNPDPEAPPPTMQGGPVVSTGLQATIAGMQQMINTSSNTFAAQQGNANAQQSGAAGLQQIEQGNVGNIKWFKDLEVAICYTGKILINAIPRVYDATRQVRILGEDGTGDIVTLNEQKFDRQTGQIVTLNDLSLGNYDVVCEVGPAFNSAQKEAARAFEAMAAVAPEVAQMSMDLWLKNRKEPGMDLAAERSRAQLFNAGMIPEEQWTDEERQQVAEQQAMAAQQPPQPDPMELAALAEMEKAKAEQANAANKQLEVQTKAQLEAQKIQLENKKIDLETQKFLKSQDDSLNVDAAKLDQEQQKIDLQAQKQSNDAALKLTELEQKHQTELNRQAQQNKPKTEE